MSDAQVTAVTTQRREDQLSGQEEQPPQPELSGTQLTALGAISDGSSFQEAAKAAGVHRATVYRWLQSDPHFRAAYNTWQHELRESARARLLKLSEQAVAVVQKELVQHKNEKVAVAILRDLGLLKSSGGGMTDARRAAREIQVEAQENDFGLDGRAIKDLLEKSGLNSSQRARLLSDYINRPMPQP